MFASKQGVLIHISLASFLWDICKQPIPVSDAAERGVCLFLVQERGVCLFGFNSHLTCLVLWSIVSNSYTPQSIYQDISSIFSALLFSDKMPDATAHDCRNIFWNIILQADTLWTYNATKMGM